MILAIDTSVGISLAIHDGQQIIAEITRNEHGIQGELTAALVKAMLTECAKSPQDLTQIIVGVGPGPFTGLRVGIASAQAFGFALSIPVSGICSLDAVGFAAGGHCIAVSDARRKELYAAHFNSQRIGLPIVVTAEQLADQFPDARFVGPAAQLYPHTISGELLDLKASDLAQTFVSGKAEVLPVVPMYLRKPDAQETAARQKTTIQEEMTISKPGPVQHD